MAISLVKAYQSNPSFELLQKPPRTKRRNLNFDVAPGGLVPLGDTGLWVTPDEPADPQDCERYEGSAFCTPFFFTLTPLSFVPAIVIDRCNLGIRVDYSIGFIRLPPVAIVYRDPSDACKPPPPPLAPPGNTGLIPFPYNFCDEDTQSIIVVPYTRTYNAEWYNEKDRLVSVGGAQLRMQKGYYSEQAVDTYTVESIEFPYKGAIGDYIDSNGIPRKKYSARINFRYTRTYNRTRNYADLYDIPGSPTSGNESGAPFILVGNTIRATIDDITDVLVLQMSVNSAKEYLKDLANENYTTPHYDADREIDGYESVQVTKSIVIKCGRESRDKYLPSPIEYNPLPRRCCMACCPSQGEQDNSLLALLMQKVDKLSAAVGVNEYPISLPKSLISKDEGFFGNILANENIEVPNLSIFLAWYVERFDEILGQWEIPIEIKDSDPTKPGEQPVGIKLPNVAECLAEMFTLCFQTNINTEIILNMGMRILAETGADKQQNFVTYKLLQSLTDWVGYKQKDTKQKMPLLFTLNKTRYDEILKESEVDVPVPEFDEKFGLEADLMKFREAVAILQANHKVKIDPNGNIKAQILKYLVDSFRSVNKVNGEDAEQDFEDFIEEVETGFINTRGVTNNTEPYGKPFNERPRIRDLTNFETDNPTP